MTYFPPDFSGLSLEENKRRGEEREEKEKAKGAIRKGCKTSTSVEQ